MKFYFCESCGRRLTEEELMTGKAFDKQAKGYYCKGCAVNVMTAEFDSVKEKSPPEVRERKAAIRQQLHASEHCIQTKYSRAGRAPLSRASASDTPIMMRYFLLSILIVVCLALCFLWVGYNQNIPTLSQNKDLGNSSPVPYGGIDRPGEQPHSSLNSPAKSIFAHPEIKSDEPPKQKDYFSAPTPRKNKIEGALQKPSDRENFGKTTGSELEEEYLEALVIGDKQAARAALNAAELASIPFGNDRIWAIEQMPLTWLEEIDKAVFRGAEGLKGIELFELKLVAGEILHVGKRTALPVIGAKDGVLQLGEQNMTIFQPVSLLHPDAQIELAQLGLESKGHGLVLRAFLAWRGLAMGREGISASTVEQLLDNARDAASNSVDQKWIEDRVRWAELHCLETGAKHCVADFERQFEAKRWDAASLVSKTLLSKYSNTHTFKSATGIEDRIQAVELNKAPVEEFTITLQNGLPIPEFRVKQYNGGVSTYICRGSTAEQNYSRKDWISCRDLSSLRAVLFLPIFESDGGPLPTTVTILDAKLSVCKVSTHIAYNPTMALVRILSPWKVTEVTWNQSAKGQPWNTPGGDLDQEVVARTDFKPNESWGTFNVTDCIRAMQRDSKNDGWILYSINYSSYVSFCSERSQPISNAPKLVLKLRGPRFKAPSKE